ncbi:MAG: BON domain-containing protein [Nitrospinae bacterium]|nr:BON domain-containing protein [Nitrospinota bacterium]
MNKKFTLLITGIIISFLPTLSGCIFVVAGGAGAEAGYVAGKKEQSAGEVIDDQWITTKIKTKLIADPDLKAFQINVDTENGVVTLKGRVGSKDEAEKAVIAAKNTKGVKKVINKLTLK